MFEGIFGVVECGDIGEGSYVVVVWYWVVVDFDDCVVWEDVFG